MSNLNREILIPESQIQQEVNRVASEIARDYRDFTQVLLAVVLKGGYIFGADLQRGLYKANLHQTIVDFIAISSYADGMVSTGKPRITQDLTESVEGQHVVIVEDVIDSGCTLAFLDQVLRDRGAASVQIAALLRKVGLQQVPVNAKYVCFDIGNEWIDGYGIDTARQGRGNPNIAKVIPATTS